MVIGEAPTTLPSPNVGLPEKKWYEDGVQRTVVEYPPQGFAPGGSHNVFYNGEGDEVRLMREEANVEPGSSGITSVYRLRCEVTDPASGKKIDRDYYISHGYEVILQDQGNGKMEPIRLHNLIKKVTIGAPLPAADGSDTPVPNNPKLKSVLLFADQWREPETGPAVEVRQDIPFLNNTLPPGVFPRGKAPGENPIVAVLPLFRQGDKALKAQGL